MSITIADDILAAALAETNETVEIRSRDGRVLGTFVPGARGAHPRISEAELRRREDDHSGRHFTAAEVEARLRELRCTQ